MLNAGTNKKDADYLAGISKKYLLEDVDLAAHTFASVSDGARACLNALDILQEDEFIVPIRCQSHAMSLFLKAIAKGPFHVMINKADDLFPGFGAGHASTVWCVRCRQGLFSAL